MKEKEAVWGMGIYAEAEGGGGRPKSSEWRSEGREGEMWEESEKRVLERKNGLNHKGGIQKGAKCFEEGNVTEEGRGRQERRDSWRWIM